MKKIEKRLLAAASSQMSSLLDRFYTKVTESQEKPTETEDMHLCTAWLETGTDKSGRLPFLF